MRNKLAGLLLAGAMYTGIASAADVFVRIAPPRPAHRGAIGIAPSRNHIWANGFQEWDGRAYRWHEGSWVARPNPRARWVEPRWVHRRGGYVFVAGHWRG